MSQPDSLLHGGERIEPRCPICKWHLTFIASDGKWEALCWNRQCPVKFIPANYDEELFRFVAASDHPVTTTEVADRFGWKGPNASAHLMKLLHLGLVSRRKRLRSRSFEWRSAA